MCFGFLLKQNKEHPFCVFFCSSVWLCAESHSSPHTQKGDIVLFFAPREKDFVTGGRKKKKLGAYFEFHRKFQNLGQQWEDTEGEEEELIYS